MDFILAFCQSPGLPAPRRTR